MKLTVWGKYHLIFFVGAPLTFLIFLSSVLVFDIYEIHLNNYDIGIFLASSLIWILIVSVSLTTIRCPRCKYPVGGTNSIFNVPKPWGIIRDKTCVNCKYKLTRK